MYDWGSSFLRRARGPVADGSPQPLRGSPSLLRLRRKSNSRRNTDPAVWSHGSPHPVEDPSCKVGRGSDPSDTEGRRTSRSGTLPPVPTPLPFFPLWSSPQGLRSLSVFPPFPWTLTPLDLWRSRNTPSPGSPQSLRLMGTVDL